MKHRFGTVIRYNNTVSTEQEEENSLLFDLLVSTDCHGCVSFVMFVIGAPNILDIVCVIVYLHIPIFFNFQIIKFLEISK